MMLSVESWLALVLWVVALWLAWVGLMGRQLLITAPVAFLLYQGVNVLGVVVESSRMEVFRSDWPVLVALGYLLVVLGGIAANVLSGFRPQIEVPEWRDSPLRTDEGDTRARWLLVWFIVAVSVGAGLMFYRAVGYNSLLGQLQGIISGAGVSYVEFASQRAGVLSGGYVAAGYTVQFIGIILPTLVAYIWVEGVLRRSRWLVVMAGLLLVASCFFVTIQGGRTYILAIVVLAVFMVGGDTSPLPKQFRLRRTTSAVLGAGFILAFGGVTALQGRVNSESGGTGILSMATSLWERLGGDYSRTQMIALRALEPEIPANGAQWWTQLLIVLPGAPADPVPFDVRVYYIIYGSMNGNNPLDPWGSYYYNFGVSGLLIICFLLGLCSQWLTIVGLVRAGRNVATVVIMSAIGYRFMFVIDPYTLFLVGPVTLLFLHWLLRLFTPDARRRSGRRIRYRVRA